MVKGKKMNLGLNDKAAIVTGGSAGIGLACAKTLCREGVHVLIAARNSERLEAAAESIKSAADTGEKPKVITVSADLTLEADIHRISETALEQFNHIDILINNAGSARAGAFLDLSDDAFLDAWNLKLLGYIRMVRAVLPHMSERKDGRIVNIIGGAGRTPSPDFLPGSTANAALLNFTRGISKELAQNKIRINAISPGKTATERAKTLNKQIAEAKGITEQDAWSESIRSIPLGRMVEPEEIAAMAAFLVSDFAASITGTEIGIDGGATPGV